MMISRLIFYQIAASVGMLMGLGLAMIQTGTLVVGTVALLLGIAQVVTVVVAWRRSRR